ncbi:MAG: Transcriptional regulator, TrmB [Candidatus Magasanikbacteria bacterium GW2011_GWA2_56_11]|uniref:Transcriptional regulator, TrmB n=1 Tax=Candidatus Magasanikbacteria bacterium GW2011_GWA2_56_11 TaxID=1619044 RepID=A0A0G1YFX8_9BACT|nr:MAG: Transcriptional regulator, TrmB [Candidatus Magasanikbacteria bacterium GW2011_GWA2_56_11]
MLPLPLLDALGALGLTPKQAGIYFACLESGPATVGRIAQRAGEKRTTAYSILQELTRQGLLKAAKSGNKYLFSPEKPAELLEKLEEKKEKIKGVLPFLNDKFLHDSPEPRLEMFTGRQIAKLFDRMLMSREKKLFMIRSDADKSDVIGREFHFGARRREKKISTQVLLPRDTKKLTRDQQYFANQRERQREVRLLPVGLDVTSDIFIFDSTVVTISPRDRIGFCVVNQDFAAFMKGVFNMLWGISQSTFARR